MFGSVDFQGWPLKDAMQRVSQADSGVIVILRQATENNKLLQWMMTDSDEKKKSDKNSRDIRTDGVGAQILMDVGVHKMKLMTAPKVIHGLGGFGLEVVEYVSGEE